MWGARCEEQSLGRAREGRKVWGTEQRGGRREGRGDLGTGHWLGRVAIRGHGQWIGFGSRRIEGGQEPVWHMEAGGGGEGSGIWDVTGGGGGAGGSEAWTWSPDKAAAE